MIVSTEKKNKYKFESKIPVEALGEELMLVYEVGFSGFANERFS